MNNCTNQTNFEEAVFPAEFLDCLTETAFKTLTDHLINTGASQDVLDLLDSAKFLLKQAVQLEWTSGKVDHSTNQTIMESVSDASRCIAALGGVFYAPSGTSLPCEAFLVGSDLKA